MASLLNRVEPLRSHLRGFDDDDSRRWLLILSDRYSRNIVCRVILMAGLQLGLVGAYASQAIADSDHSALTIRPAFLPIPNTMDESGDPKEFRPAVLSAVLHVFLSCKGGVKEAEFEAVRQWLVAQGFTIVRALGPEAGRTYPSIRFNGTVRQFNEAFHITVMSKLLHPRYCYAVFTDWMMPARFAPKGAEYIQDYEFSSDGDPGLSTLCH